MGIGMPRVRNWGKEAQEAQLRIAMERGRVTYKVRGDRLLLAPHANGITLPFQEVARLQHVGRGRWHALSLWDDRKLARGVSVCDVVRATIQEVWH